jgi:hypothetical protein
VKNVEFLLASSRMLRLSLQGFKLSTGWLASPSIKPYHDIPSKTATVPESLVTPYQLQHPFAAQVNNLNVSLIP